MIKRYKLPVVISVKFGTEERASTEALILKHWPMMEETTTGRELFKTILGAYVRAHAAPQAPGVTAPAEAPAADIAAEIAEAVEAQRLKDVGATAKLLAEKDEAAALLVNEIGRLKTAATLKDEEIARIKYRPEGAPPSYTEPGCAPNTTILGEFDEVITFDPIFAMLVDIEAAEAERKKSKVQTRAQVLKNLFLDTVKRRDSYPLCKAYSAADLQRVADKAREQQAAKNTPAQ